MIVVHVRTGRTKLSGAVGHVALPPIGDSATHFDVTRRLAGAVGRLTGDLCQLPVGAQLKFGFRAAWMERTKLVSKRGPFAMELEGASERRLKFGGLSEKGPPSFESIWSRAILEPSPGLGLPGG